MNAPPTQPPSPTALAGAPGLLAKVKTLAFAAAVLLTAGWVFVTAQRDIRADLTAGPARFTSQRWAEGINRPASRGQWEAAVAELKAAVDIHPQDPALHETLGNAWMVGATQDWASESDKAQWLSNATERYTRATALRPHDGLIWAELAGAMARAGNLGPATLAAAENALKLGPNEGHVHQAVMLLALEHWDVMSPALQKWATDLYEGGTQAQREAINRLGEPFGMGFESDSKPRDSGKRKAQGAS